jgi:hypothetical protein
MRRFLLNSFQFFLLTALAQAQSVTDAVEDFRLIGIWSADCYKPASPRNEHATFSKTARSDIQLVNDFGGSYDNMVYRIVQAARVDGERMSLRQVLSTDRRIVLDTVIWKVNDKIRIWSSHVSDGTTLVKDGVVDSTNGHETPWEGRCNERRAVNPRAAHVLATVKPNDRPGLSAFWPDARSSKSAQ